MIRSFLNRRAGPAPIAPDRPFWAVGDIHGRADLLLRLESLMIREAPGLPAVFVGNYIDRGPGSAEVLRLLSSGSDDGDQPIICLRGKHEQMLLDFLDAPTRAGPGWLRHGGLQTLESFGITNAGKADGPEALQRHRDRLETAMGHGLITWLRSRPLLWQSGNVVVTPAGADPDKPMSDQLDKVLLRGHLAFTRTPRSDGLWVVHGHTLTREPAMQDGRIAIDTGAYATGRLTAALIRRGDLRFHRA